MSTASHTEVVERLLRRGIADPRTAERALRATMSILGQRLMDDEAAALARHLPPEIGHALDQSEYDHDFDSDELYERIRRAEHVSESVAREHVAVVLSAIADLLAPEVRSKVARALPPDVGEHLLPRDPGNAPPHAATSRGLGPSTLATGRPGSTRPLSEAAPPRGQTHSVAVNDDPHGETKLSSSRGLTQERHGETVATARGD